MLTVSSLIIFYESCQEQNAERFICNALYCHSVTQPPGYFVKSYCIGLLLQNSKIAKSVIKLSLFIYMYTVSMPNVMAAQPNIVAPSAKIPQFRSLYQAAKFG